MSGGPIGAAQRVIPGAGGIWNTNGYGAAMQPQNRPALSGGLQQMQMFNAYRAGAPMSQLQAMNPYTPRPAQFLPPALPAYSWAADPSNPANQAPARPFASGLTDIAGGDGTPGDGGADAGGGGGGGGSK